jgi:hypothetical protein
VRERGGIIVLDEPGEFLAFLVLGEGLRVDVAFLDEPGAEFGLLVVLAAEKGERWNGRKERGRTRRYR